MVCKIMAECPWRDTSLSSYGTDSRTAHATTPDDSPDGGGELRASVLVIHNFRHHPFLAQPYRALLRYKRVAKEGDELSLSELGTLTGLALADSTSIGTLAIPVWLLMRSRFQIRRILLYLSVVAGFYWSVSLMLLASTRHMAIAAHGFHLSQSWSWIQIAIGAIVLVIGFWIDRPSQSNTKSPSRTQRWRNRALRLDDDRSVIGLGLTASLMELATMVPLLTAIGMLKRSDMSVVASGLAVTGYVALMMFPAGVLVLARMAFGERMTKILATIRQQLEVHAHAITATVLMAVGSLISIDAALRLNLIH